MRKMKRKVGYEEEHGEEAAGPHNEFKRMCIDGGKDQSHGEAHMSE